MDITSEDIALITQFKAQTDQQIADLTKLSNFCATVLASPPVDVAVKQEKIDELTKSVDDAQTVITSLTQERDEAKAHADSLAIQLDEAIQANKPVEEVVP